MKRINYPIKLSELVHEATKALGTYGDRYVLISDDEEGNGFHECYFGISDAKDFPLECLPMDLEPKDCVLLG